jgi:hypothetical protein
MKTRLLKLASVCLIVTGLIAFASWQPVKAVQATSTTSAALVRLGTASLSAPVASPVDVGDSLDEFRRGDIEDEVNRRIPATSNASARVPADHVPAPPSKAIASTNPGLLGFDGLTHLDQRNALAYGLKNTQFSKEPPDQGLCVGNGFVVETVNTAVRVRTTSGVSLTGVVPLNQFFGLRPEVIRATETTLAVYGQFMSDPKCYYDASLSRFFLTALEIDVDPRTGDFSGSSSVLIAVSKTSDPTAQWYTFKLDTTNDGKSNHPGCPCFGDQPLIGADANGFYVTTNEFPLSGAGFNGAQVYAMSKSALAGGLVPALVRFEGPIALAEAIAYSVQPAATPPGGAFASAAGGTEYFMSSLEFTGSLDNRIAVWALTNTRSLNDRVPNVALSYVVVESEVYGMPIPAAEQPDGPRPLGDQLKAKVEFLDSNDDRMNQVVYAAGKLFSGVNTVVKTENAPARAGIAYFVVTPAVSSRGVLSASMFNQGYISVNRAHVMFPAVAVNTTGVGAITFTLSALDRYPSAAYVTLNRDGAASDVHIAATGAGPEDGFTGYAVFGGNRVARWGDYSAATVDETGRIWMATEYIPNLPRTPSANWGTYIASLTP